MACLQLHALSLEIVGLASVLWFLSHLGGFANDFVSDSDHRISTFGTFL